MGSTVKHPERNALITQLRDLGWWPTEIAREMGVSRNTVIGVLNRAGRCRANVDRSSCALAFAPRGEAHGRALLSPDAVLDIRENWKRYSRDRGLSYFAKKYGVHQQTVQMVTSGRTWRHV